MKNQKQNNNGVYLGVKSAIPVVFEDYNKTSKNNNVLVLGKTEEAHRQEIHFCR